MAEAFYNGRDLTQVNALEYAIDMGAVRGLNELNDKMPRIYPIPMQLKPERVNDTSTRITLISERNERKLCEFIVHLDHRKEVHIERFFYEENNPWISDLISMCEQRGIRLMGVIMDVIFSVTMYNDTTRVTLRDTWHSSNGPLIDSDDIRNYAGYLLQVAQYLDITEIRPIQEARKAGLNENIVTDVMKYVLDPANITGKQDQYVDMEQHKARTQKLWSIMKLWKKKSKEKITWATFLRRFATGGYFGQWGFTVDEVLGGKNMTCGKFEYHRVM